MGGGALVTAFAAALGSGDPSPIPSTAERSHLMAHIARNQDAAHRTS